MMKVPFKYYLHDDSRYETADSIYREVSAFVDTSVDEIADKIEYSPFYEVELSCEYDTETGEVTLLSARL